MSFLICCFTRASVPPARVQFNAETLVKQAHFRIKTKKVAASHKMRLTLNMCCATLCELTCLVVCVWRKPKLE